MTNLKHAVPRVTAAVTALILATVVAGCGNNNANTPSSPKKEISIGVVPGWDDYNAEAQLLKAILEPKGYTVDIKEFSEVATNFAGVAKGDLDVIPAAPDRLHKAYWDKYQDKLEDLGAWYDNTALFLAVPDYMTDVQSISDLPASASKFGGKIVGIEPGAGITKLAQEKALPDYGLDKDFQLQLSSTSAMLAELKKATDSQQPIVVTAWSPFWANSVFKLRALKDPKGSFGEPEKNHTLARKGFTKDFPDVAAMISALKLSDKQLEDLENSIVNEFPKGQEQQAVKAWLDKNPDVAPALEKNLKS